MAMGVISKDAFEKELQRHLISTEEVSQNENDKDGTGVITRALIHGRNGSKAVPQVIKEVVAVESLLGASNAELAEEFGLSLSSISAYKNGSNSTSSYHEKNDKLSSVINDVASKLQKKAQFKLEEALDALDISDPDLKARDISAVAKDMSIIFKNLEPEKDINLNVQNNKIVVYRPRMKEEEDYETIEVVE